MTHQLQYGAGTALGGVGVAGALMVEGALLPLHIAKRAIEARRTMSTASRERAKQGERERVQLIASATAGEKSGPLGERDSTAVS